MLYVVYKFLFYYTMDMTFKLIIGVGNPGKKYQNTHHNAGYLFVDYLESQKSKVKSQMLKTNVYMNKSGSFIKKALKKFNVNPEELLIVHDDSDILLGEYKLSLERGAAGHHGIENIILTLKTKKFWRLRIGIRPNAPQGMPRLKAGQFVLKPVRTENKKILDRVFEKALLEIKKGSFEK